MAVIVVVVIMVVVRVIVAVIMVVIMVVIAGVHPTIIAVEPPARFGSWVFADNPFGMSTFENDRDDPAT